MEIYNEDLNISSSDIEACEYIPYLTKLRKKMKRHIALLSMRLDELESGEDVMSYIKLKKYRRLQLILLDDIESKKSSLVREEKAERNLANEKAAYWARIVKSELPDKWEDYCEKANEIFQ